MPARVNKVVCACCGAANILEETDGPEQENWLPCIAPEGFEWTLPGGRIVPVVGAPIYVDAFSAKMSREEYLAKYNVDPEIALNNMRSKVNKPCVGVGACADQDVTEEKPKRKVVRLGSH